LSGKKVACSNVPSRFEKGVSRNMCDILRKSRKGKGRPEIEASPGKRKERSPVYPSCRGRGREGEEIGRNNNKNRFIFSGRFGSGEKEERKRKEERLEKS